MNIQTLTSSKNYSNHHLNVCPSDEAGLMRYSSSPPTSRYHGQPVKSPSSPMNHQNSYTSSPSYSTSSSKEGSDLQSVVSKYQANPELLKLILASKVEEDKRRTEEAKLRAKELDLYFQQQQQQQQVVRKPEPKSANRNSLLFEKSQQDQTSRRRSSCSSTSSNGSTINSTGANDSSIHHHHRRIAPYSIPRPIAINNSTAPRRNSSASSALLSINRLSINNNNSTTMQSKQESNLASSAPSSTSQYLYQSPSNNARTIISPDNKPLKTSRRRRSMQAISKIVETVDNPYEDGHFWKNNGNTIQKKTGCKSVYYKCANSCKGCPVNKTVIEQPDHSFVIKYRGEHVSECFQVEHIRDL